MVLGETLIGEANATIAQEGVAKDISSAFFNENRGAVDGPVNSFIAQRSLYHIVELDRLFDYESTWQASHQLHETKEDVTACLASTPTSAIVPIMAPFWAA